MQTSISTKSFTYLMLSLVWCLGFSLQAAPTGAKTKQQLEVIQDYFGYFKNMDVTGMQSLLAADSAQVGTEEIESMKAESFFSEFFSPIQSIDLKVTQVQKALTKPDRYTALLHLKMRMKDDSMIDKYVLQELIFSNTLPDKLEMIYVYENRKFKVQ